MHTGLGIVTNTASVLLLRSTKHDSSQDGIMQTCLLWLAVSDLCATVTGFIHILIEGRILGGMVDFGYWSVPALWNYIFYFLFLMFLGLSSVILVVIAVVRCIMIKWPLESRGWVTSKKVRYALIVGALSTFILFLPTSSTAMWQLCFNETKVEGCKTVIKSMPGLESASQIYLYTIGLLFIFVPVLIYIVCFTIIEMSLRSSVTDLRGLRDSGVELAMIRQRVSRQVTRQLLCIMVLDTLVTLPTIASSVALIVSSDLLFNKDKYPEFHVFDSLSEILLLLRPTYNFWLYVFIRAEFRDRILLYGKMLCHPKSHKYKSQTSTTTCTFPIMNRTHSAEANMTTRTAIQTMEQNVDYAEAKVEKGEEG